MRLAVPLVKPLDDHGPGWHVDAEGERLGGVHDPYQARLEQFLHHLLEGGQQSRVVGGDAALQAGQPLPVPEHRQVRLWQVRGAPPRHLGDDLRLFRRGQPQPGVQALAHRRVAGGPGEDERDGRQQPRRVQPLDDQRPARRPGPGRPAPAAHRTAGGPAQCLLLPPRQPQQVRVDLR